MKNPIPESFEKYLPPFSLKCNEGMCFKGISPNGRGFVVDNKMAIAWVQQDSKNEEVLFPFYQGKSINDGAISSKKTLIDFGDKTKKEASEYLLPFTWVESKVKKERLSKKTDIKRLKKEWWLFEGKRRRLKEENQKAFSCFALAENSDFLNFSPVPSDVICGAKVFVFPSVSYYLLGILSSGIHKEWVDTFGTKERKNHITYSKAKCFCTFPFPQEINHSQFQEIEDWMKRIQDYRGVEMKRRGVTLSGLYRSDFLESGGYLSWLYENLDRAVLSAYNLSEKDNIAEKLLALNISLKKKEETKNVIGALNYKGF